MAGKGCDRLKVDFCKIPSSNETCSLVIAWASEVSDRLHFWASGGHSVKLTVFISRGFGFGFGSFL